jgi:hypothetical protein
MPYWKQPIDISVDIIDKIRATITIRYFLLEAEVDIFTAVYSEYHG